MSCSPLSVPLNTSEEHDPRNPESVAARKPSFGAPAPGSPRGQTLPSNHPPPPYSLGDSAAPGHIQHRQPARRRGGVNNPPPPPPPAGSRAHTPRRGPPPSHARDAPPDCSPAPPAPRPRRRLLGPAGWQPDHGTRGAPGAPRARAGGRARGGPVLGGDQDFLRKSRAQEETQIGNGRAWVRRRAGEGSPREGLKAPGEGPVAALQEGTQLLSTRMCRAVGTGSRLFWELCAGVFFSWARVPRQESPSPMLSSGPSSSASRQPGARGQHLLA